MTDYSSYPYTWEINIDNPSSSALVGQITIPWILGIKNDYSDLRFSDTNNNAITYQLVSYVDSVSAILKISVPADATKILMHFGNWTVSTASQTLGTASGLILKMGILHKYIYGKDPLADVAPTGWTIGCNGLSRSIDSVNGYYSLCITGDGSSGVRGSIYQNLTLSPGTYKITAVIKIVGRTSGFFNIDFYGGSPAVDSSGVWIDYNTDWIQVEHEEAINSTNPMLRIFVDGTPNAGSYFWVDSVKITTGSTVITLNNNYFDNWTDPAQIYQVSYPDPVHDIDNATYERVYDSSVETTPSGTYNVNYPAPVDWNPGNYYNNNRSTSYSNFATFTIQGDSNAHNLTGIHYIYGVANENITGDIYVTVQVGNGNATTVATHNNIRWGDPPYYISDISLNVNANAGVPITIRFYGKVNQLIAGGYAFIEDVHIFYKYPQSSSYYPFNTLVIQDAGKGQHVIHLDYNAFVSNPSNPGDFYVSIQNSGYNGGNAQTIDSLDYVTSLYYSPTVRSIELDINCAVGTPTYIRFYGRLTGDLGGSASVSGCSVSYRYINDQSWNLLKTITVLAEAGKSHHFLQVGCNARTTLATNQADFYIDILNNGVATTLDSWSKNDATLTARNKVIDITDLVSSQTLIRFYGRLTEELGGSAQVQGCFADYRYPISENYTVLDTITIDWESEFDHTLILANYYGYTTNSNNQADFKLTLIVSGIETILDTWSTTATAQTLHSVNLNNKIPAGSIGYIRLYGRLTNELGGSIRAIYPLVQYDRTGYTESVINANFGLLGMNSTATSLQHDCSLGLMATIITGEIEELLLEVSLGLSASIPIMKEYNTFSDFNLSSLKLHKGINDLYWQLTADCADLTIPPVGFPINYDMTIRGVHTPFFRGNITSTPVKLSYKGSTKQIYASDISILLNQKIPWDAQVIDLESTERVTWAQWIDYLVGTDDTGISFYTLGSSDAINIQIVNDPNTTRYEAIQKISNYCQMIFFVKFVQLQPGVLQPQGFWLSPYDIDNKEGGLNLPEPLIFTWPDNSIVNEPTISDEQNTKYNSATVWGTRSDTEEVEAFTARSQKVVNQEENPLEFVQKDMALAERETTAKIEAIKWLLYQLSPQDAVTMKFVNRGDLELYQRIKFGSGFPKELQELTNLSPISSVNVSNTVSNSGSVFYDGWQKVQSVNITNSPGSGFQILIPVTFNALMKSDFSDLRFSTETEILPYWIISKVDSVSANVLVKITSETIIYMYFGNSSANSESSMSNVCEFSEDFTQASLDSSKWNGTATISNGIATVSYPNSIYTNLTFGRGYEIISRSKFNLLSGSNASIGLGSTSPTVIIDGTYSRGKYAVYAAITGSNSRFVTNVSFDSNFHIFRLAYNSSAVLKIDSATTTLTLSIPSTAMPIYVSGSTSSCSVDLDFIAVRKYNGADPTLTWGNIVNNIGIDVDTSGVPRPSWLRIIDLSYDFNSSGSVITTAKMVVDFIYSNADPYVDTPYAQYINSGYRKPPVFDNTSQIQSVVEYNLGKITSPEMGTVNSISIDGLTMSVTVDSGKVLTVTHTDATVNQRVLVSPDGKGGYIGTKVT